MASVVDAPLYKLPLRVALGPTHSGLAVGIAQGALADLAELAKTKRPAFNPMQRLAEDPVFQWHLGEVATRLDAARNYHEGVVQEMWEKAQSAVPVTAMDNLRLRSMVSWVHREAMAVTNEAFTLAGSNALYDTSPLQRRWRDIRAMSQHQGVPHSTCSSSAVPYDGQGRTRVPHQQLTHPQDRAARRPIGCRREEPSSSR